MWDKCYRVYCRTEETVVGAGLVAIVTLTFMNAVLRIFKAPIIVADDLSLLLFSWVAFLGADVALRYSRLVGMDILVKKFSPRVQKLTQLLVYTVIAVILAVLVNGGLTVIAKNPSRPFNTLPVPYSWVTMSLPACSVLMIFTCAVKIGKLLKRFRDDAYNVRKDNPDVVGEENAGLDEAKPAL